MSPAPLPKGVIGPRNEAMAEMYRSGMTLQQIGDAYHMTRERVRQCLAMVGLSGKDGGAAKIAADRAAERAAKMDAKYIRRTGMPFAEYKAAPKRAKRAYLRQKANAKIRGISWEITFAQWWDVWQKSGKWAERGRGQGYCMGRKGDAGPYAVGNVYICTVAQNASDSYVWKPVHLRNRPHFAVEINGHRWASKAEAARAYGIPSNTVDQRLKRGWPIDSAFTTPAAMTNTRARKLAAQAT